MTIRLHSDLSGTISENSRVAAATRRRGTDRGDDDDDDDVFERGFRVDCGRREGGKKEEEGRQQNTSANYVHRSINCLLERYHHLIT